MGIAFWRREELLFKFKKSCTIENNYSPHRHLLKVMLGCWEEIFLQCKVNKQFNWHFVLLMLFHTLVRMHLRIKGYEGGNHSRAIRVQPVHIWGPENEILCLKAPRIIILERVRRIRSAEHLTPALLCHAHLL